MRIPSKLLEVEQFLGQLAADIEQARADIDDLISETSEIERAVAILKAERHRISIEVEALYVYPKLVSEKQAELKALEKYRSTHGNKGDLTRLQFRIVELPRLSGQ